VASSVGIQVGGVGPVGSHVLVSLEVGRDLEKDQGWPRHEAIRTESLQAGVTPSGEMKMGEEFSPGPGKHFRKNSASIVSFAHSKEPLRPL